MWFVGVHRGTYFGDRVFDRFLNSHNGNIVEAFKEAEQPGLNSEGETVSLRLLRSVQRNRVPTLHYNNVVLKYVKQVVSIKSKSLNIGAANSIDNRGMEDVAERAQLESLNLNGLRITDAGLKKLHSLQHLKQLPAYVTECTEQRIAEFRQAVPECEVLWGRPQQ